MDRKEWNWGESRIVLGDGGLTNILKGRIEQSLFIPWRAIGKITRDVRSRGTRAAGVLMLVLAAAFGAYSIAVAQQSLNGSGSPLGNFGAGLFGFFGIIFVAIPNRVTTVRVFGHAGQTLWSSRRLGNEAGEEGAVFQAIVDGLSPTNQAPEKDIEAPVG